MVDKTKLEEQISMLINYYIDNKETADAIAEDVVNLITKGEIDWSK